MLLQGVGRMERVIGIDLGTTNSCVAICEQGRPKVIPSRGGYKTIPSIVALLPNGKRLVGHVAKRQAVTNAENTVFGSKRFIGRHFDAEDTKDIISFCPYKTTSGSQNDVRISLFEKSYSIPELSAIILSEIKKMAEDYFGGPVTQAVVTVPAYFNDAQRQATKDAGKIAGLDILRIINEPTAAALAYGFGKGFNKKVAVFDLGGGTFDISILEICDDVYEVLSTTGDTMLGGDDFDSRIMTALADKFLEETGVDLKNDRMALQRLKDESEKLKCALSQTQSYEVNLPFIASKGQDPLHMQMSITRQWLDTLVSDLVDRCFISCNKALSDAGITVDDLNDIILVGGQTRMPLIQTRVQEFFKKVPSKNVHPDEAVALGAAIQGNVLLDDKSNLLLLDVTPFSLGIATIGGRFSRLIPRNTTIPTQKSHTFTTANDNQTTVKIVVMQGESFLSKENQLLGEFYLTGIRQLPKGLAEIDVTFSINADGIVSVHAKDRDTGKEQFVVVKSSACLEDSEITKLIDEHQKANIQEAPQRNQLPLSTNIENLKYEIENLLNHPNAINYPIDIVFFEKRLKNAQIVLDANDEEQMLATKSELQKLLHILESCRHSS